MLIEPTLIVLCSSMKSVEKESAKKESEKGKYMNTNSDLREPGELWEHFDDF